MTSTRTSATTSKTTEPVTIPAAGGYRIDPTRSTITFSTRHLFGLAPVRGTFRLRSGHIQVADLPERSTAEATVASESFHTGTSARDTQVRSAAYLDAVRHPDIVFASTGLSRSGDDWVLEGTLTVRGLARPLSLRVLSLSPAESGLRLRAAARVDRYEFGITAGRGIIGRRLSLSLDVVGEATERGMNGPAGRG
ncbi:MAG: YceI family protein [Actinophytocola sp.]|uniref:YceI family protein n=1 Tax=Actinophytocola sp. TaxID=1872138 RepID=UPI003D6AE831